MPGLALLRATPAASLFSPCHIILMIFVTSGFVTLALYSLFNRHLSVLYIAAGCSDYMLMIVVIS
jgi:hypothetical protein